MIPLDNPRRILIVKPSALGDIVQALPVLTALRERFPAAHIAWVINKSYASLLAGHPHLDEVLPFDRALWRRGVTSGFMGTLRFFRLLRGRHFDLAIDLQCLLRSALFAWASGAPIRVGLTSGREGAGWFYTHEVKDSRETEHAVDRYWHVAEELGLGAKPKRFVLPENQEANAWADDLLKTMPRPWLAVSVGSRWVTKRWPVAHFQGLLTRAGHHARGSVFFVGARDEADLAERASHGLPLVARNLAGRTTLPQLTALLRRADVMISNDTGPLHLAVALGRPIVAPYTCTQARRNGPYGQLERAVETQVFCAGSYVRHCERMDCMRDLTPDRLWPVLREILSPWQASRRSA